MGRLVMELVIKREKEIETTNLKRLNENPDNVIRREGAPEDPIGGTKKTAMMNLRKHDQEGTIEEKEEVQEETLTEKMEISDKSEGMAENFVRMIEEDSLAEEEAAGLSRINSDRNPLWNQRVYHRILRFLLPPMTSLTQSTHGVTRLLIPMQSPLLFR
jgi:hypothetical protein